MDNMLEIKEYNDEGYSKVISFESWRVAILNYAERFDERYINKLERHILTDEVFVLLEGKAELIIGTEMIKCSMDKNKLYNVKAGSWHAINVSKDAKVLIVENEITSLDNTEYMEIERMI